MQLNSLWNADQCPSALLPWLAWAMQVELWDSSWSDAQKRTAIKNSVLVHKQKGTAFAVKSALESFGWPTTITEWFQTGDDPYTFRIVVYVSIFDDQAQVIAKIEEILARTKNVRSWPYIEISTAVSGNIYVACATVDRDIVVVGT